MKIVASVKLSPAGVFVSGNERKIAAVAEESWTKTIYSELGLNYPKFYKMDPLAKMAFLGINILQESAELAEMETEEVALIFANNSSSQATDLKFIESYDERGNPSPSLFVYTLPNILTGELAIYKKWYGENVFFINENFDASFFLDQINFYLRKGANKCLCGWVNAMDDAEECFLFLVSAEDGTITTEELTTLYKQ